MEVRGHLGTLMAGAALGALSMALVQAFSPAGDHRDQAVAVEHGAADASPGASSGLLSGPLPSSSARDKLRAEVQALTHLRDKLRRKADELSLEVAQLRRQAPTCPESDAGVVAADAPPPPPEVIARLTEAVQPAFRADRLRPEHLDDLPVGALRDAFTDANRELAMLEIAAHQEGWRDDPTLKEERLALRQSLLEYLGPEAYLAGLYATGRPNRLVLTNIAAGTDADSQGLQRGDVLLAVDGSRIFDEEGFAAVTASLPPGSPVTLEILRNGHSLRYVVENPRAGLRVYAQRVDPDNYYAAE